MLKRYSTWLSSLPWLAMFRGYQNVARRCRRWRISIDVVLAGKPSIVDVDMGETRILAESHTVGQIALELIAEHFLLAPELVDARSLAKKLVGMRPNGAATTVPT